MTEDEFVRLVGETLAHVTPARNLPSIRALGLLRPLTLAEREGVSLARLSLRANPVEIETPHGIAVLNHQLPLRAGQKAQFLDGVTVEEWGALLDKRLFFWPGSAEPRFANSIAAREPMARLALDARRMFRVLSCFLDLAPINTGNAKRSPAKRGAWIYTPVTDAVEAFRGKRIARGLVQGKDSVAEVSLRADVPADLLAVLNAPEAGSEL